MFTIYNTITHKAVESWLTKEKAELALSWIEQHEERCERDGYRPEGKTAYVIIEE